MFLLQGQDIPLLRNREGQSEFMRSAFKRSAPDKLMTIVLAVGMAYAGFTFAQNPHHTKPPSIGGSGSGISVGGDPQGLAFSPATQEMYVANYASGWVSVISGTQVITNLYCCFSPVGVAYSPANQEIYVTDYGNGRVVAIDNQNRIVSTIALYNGAYPRGIAYNPSNQDIYVTNYYGNLVFVISPANQVVATISLPTSLPWGIAYNPARGDMYVTDALNNAVYE